MSGWCACARLRAVSLRPTAKLILWVCRPFLGRFFVICRVRSRMSRSRLMQALGRARALGPGVRPAEGLRSNARKRAHAHHPPSTRDGAGVSREEEDPGPDYAVSTTPGSQRSLVLNDPWFSTIPGSQRSLVLNDPWFSTIPGSQRSLVLNDPWFSTIPGSQRSLVPNDPWFSTIPGSQRSLVLNDPWFSTIPGSQRSLIRTLP